MEIFGRMENEFFIVAPTLNVILQVSFAMFWMRDIQARSLAGFKV